VNLFRRSTIPAPWAPYAVEYRKLRRSLALPIAAIVPLLIAVFTFFNLLRDHQPRPWDMWILSVSAIWAFFMLPMSVTALTALVAQVEHAPRSWDHLRALPVPRWRLYAAKAVMILLLMALMTVAVLLTGAAAVWLAAQLKPSLTPLGDFDLMRYVGVLTRMYLSSMLLIAVQLWLALRYASFVPALAIGVGGTFFAVVGTSARIGVVLPWQIPVNMLATNPERADVALLTGFAGGLAAMVVMLSHLSRREVN
jgi:hypothetical protein